MVHLLCCSKDRYPSRLGQEIRFQVRHIRLHYVAPFFFSLAVNRTTAYAWPSKLQYLDFSCRNASEFEKLFLRSIVSEYERTGTEEAVIELVLNEVMEAYLGEFII